MTINEQAPVADGPASAAVVVASSALERVSELVGETPERETPESWTVLVSTPTEWGAWRLSFNGGEPVVQRPSTDGQSLESVDLGEVLGFRVVSPQGEVRWSRQDEHTGPSAVVPLPDNGERLERWYQCWGPLEWKTFDTARDGKFAKITSTQVGTHWVWVPGAGEMHRISLRAVERIDFVDHNAVVVDEVCLGFTSVPRPTERQDD